MLKWKLAEGESLIIDGVKIEAGIPNTLRINAGKLPSGNRINVIAHVYYSGVPGPTLLIMGGVHGNEINGIETVRRSIEEKLYKDLIRGAVIVIPLLNVYGFINFSRDVADGKDVNRSFPGNMNGSLASRVARIITKKIMPHIDCALDFHTGGDARYNYPHVRFNKNDDGARRLAQFFNVRYLAEYPLISKSFRKIAFDAKIPSVVFEGGESIRLDLLSINKGLNAIKGVLHGLGMSVNQAEKNDHDQWVIKKMIWVRAVESGLFIRSKQSGEYVKKGENLGQIKDPYGTKSVDVIATKSGHIISHNNASVVSLGDALFHIGYDFELYTESQGF